MPPQHVQAENPPSARSHTGHSATPSLPSDTGHTATPPRTPAQASAIHHCSGSTAPGVTARTTPVGSEHSSAATLQQVSGQEEAQATSGSPYEPPARRVQPPRARRPPNRYLDYHMYSQSSVIPNLVEIVFLYRCVQSLSAYV